MQFKTEAHKKSYEKARDFLYTLFGDVNVTTMDDVLVLQEGSTFVYVRAAAIGELPEKARLSVSLGGIDNPGAIGSPQGACG